MVTKRVLTGQQVAYTVWRLLDGSIVFQKVKQAEYDDFVLVRKAVGDAPGRPDPDAVFLTGGGGILAVDTADGWPSVGDVWEQPNGDTGKPDLVIATGDEYYWHYSHGIASDPGLTGQSTFVEFKAQSDGHRARFEAGEFAVDAQGVYTAQSSDVSLVDDALTILIQPNTSTTTSSKTIPNHKSVTFDATDTGGSSGTTTLTIAHTVAVQSNLHLSVWVGFQNGGGQTLSGVTYNAASMGAAQVTKDPALGRRVELYAMAAPATGTNNIVITASGNGDLTGGGWSAYGADQSTLYSNTNSANATDTTPTLTITSAVGELVVTGTLDRTTNITPDATWTTDWNATGAAIRYAGCHIAGAASVTRTDSVASSQWILVGGSIKAAAAGVTYPQLERNHRGALRGMLM